jgi:hypothetical protein
MTEGGRGVPGMDTPGVGGFWALFWLHSIHRRARQRARGLAGRAATGSGLVGPYFKWGRRLARRPPLNSPLVGR